MTNRIASALLWTGRYRLVGVMLCTLAFTTCKSGSSVDRAAAQKVSDSFMADLVANRVSDAVDEMDPEILQFAGHKDVEEQVRKLFDYCGRPLDSEFRHNENGFKLYPNGRTKPMMKFFYAASTTQYAKGVCFFSVEVVPNQNGLKVTTFGPLRLQSGELPSWAR